MFENSNTNLDLRSGHPCTSAENTRHRNTIARLVEWTTNRTTESRTLLIWVLIIIFRQWNLLRCRRTAPEFSIICRYGRKKSWG